MRAVSPPSTSTAAVGFALFDDAHGLESVLAAAQAAAKAPELLRRIQLFLSPTDFLASASTFASPCCSIAAPHSGECDRTSVSHGLFNEGRTVFN